MSPSATVRYFTVCSFTPVLPNSLPFLLAAFNIVSKTKNWWVVYRDLGPTSISDMTPRKSAWVPAGCLLETTVAPLSLADPSAISSSSPSNAANVPIEPIYVVSVSTPAIALMDYTKNGSDELDAKKGTALRILKRYNHCTFPFHHYFCGGFKFSRTFGRRELRHQGGRASWVAVS